MLKKKHKHPLSPMYYRARKKGWCLVWVAWITGNRLMDKQLQYDYRDSFNRRTFSSYRYR